VPVPEPGCLPRWADDDPSESQMDYNIPPQRFILRQQTPRPCPHNDWKKVGKKRDRIVLMCRHEDCLRPDGGRTIWRIFPGEHAKCRAFYKGRCALGSECPHPHIHRKEVESERQKIYAVTRGWKVGVVVGSFAGVEPFIKDYQSAVVTRHPTLEAAEAHIRKTLGDAEEVPILSPPSSPSVSFSKTPSDTSVLQTACSSVASSSRTMSTLDSE